MRRVHYFQRQPTLEAKETAASGPSDWVGVLGGGSKCHGAVGRGTLNLSTPWWLVLLCWADVSFEMENRGQARESIRCKIRLPLPLWSDIKNWLAAEACSAKVMMQKHRAAAQPRCRHAVLRKCATTGLWRWMPGCAPGRFRVGCGGGREPMEPARTRELRAARSIPAATTRHLPGAASLDFGFAGPIRRLVPDPESRTSLALFAKPPPKKT